LAWSRSCAKGEEREFEGGKKKKKIGGGKEPEGRKRNRTLIILIQFGKRGKEKEKKSYRIF